MPASWRGVQWRQWRLWRHWAGRLALWVLALFVLAQCWFLAHVWYWARHDPDTTAFMRERLAVMQQKNPKAQLRHQWVSYDNISDELKRAVVVAEDAKFIDHDGFDWVGIEEAYKKNLQKGKVVAGGSTISQQLAKNLFLSGQRAWWRKGQEAIITVMIEQVMPKRRILEIYLNMIEWGNGVFGAQAAAQYYYNIPASALTAGQAARLAAMVPSPRKYSRGSDTPYLEKRTELILSRMPDADIP